MRKQKTLPALVAAVLLTAAACGNDVSSRLETDQRLLSPSAASGTAQERPMTVFLTGYSYWDNTPPGSAQIARPVLHRKAGGTGTFEDPITLAVGYVKQGGRSIMDYPAGTRFYIERLQKYAIVEDLCGDGPRPQDGPCHSGHQGYDWIDIYVGGKSTGKAQSDACMYRITGIQKVILNPKPGYPVLPGEISLSSCPA